ncbi:MAG: MazG-like family protein [Paenibacillaceae bacterium]
MSYYAGISEAYFNQHGSAIKSVIAERKRQDAKWGQQNHDPVYWLSILGEEVGELCQAVNETVFDNGPDERCKGGYRNMRMEAVQAAAVLIAFVECLDRRYGGDTQ